MTHDFKELPESPEDKYFGDSMEWNLSNNTHGQLYWMRRKDGTIYRVKKLLEEK